MNCCDACCWYTVQYCWRFLVIHKHLGFWCPMSVTKRVSIQGNSSSSSFSTHLESFKFLFPSGFFGVIIECLRSERKCPTSLSKTAKEVGTTAFSSNFFISSSWSVIGSFVNRYSFLWYCLLMTGLVVDEVVGILHCLSCYIGFNNDSIFVFSLASLLLPIDLLTWFISAIYPFKHSNILDT